MPRTELRSGAGSLAGAETEITIYLKAKTA